MDSPSAPQGTDPVVAADQQIRVNQATLDQLGKANNYNQVGPLGSLTWTKDPSTGQWTQTQALDPRIEQQQQQEITNRNIRLGSAGNAMQKVLDSGVAGSQIDDSALPLGWTGDDLTMSKLNTTIDASKLPGMVNNVNSQQGLTLAPEESRVPGLTTWINGGDNGALKQAQDTTYSQLKSRLDPEWAQRESQIRTQLSDMGVIQGSEAYTKAMADFNRERNDAYQGASAAAVHEGNSLEGQLFGEHAAQSQFANSAQSTAFDQAMQRAGFGNQAIGQDFQQRIASGAFANTANQQAFDQLMARAGFENTAQGQGFNEQMQRATLGNSARAQALSEMLQKRMAPINEANALESGATTMQPGFTAGQGSTTPAGAPNMATLYGQQNTSALNSYNASVGQTNSNTAAGAAVVSAALMAL